MLLNIIKYDMIKMTRDKAVLVFMVILPAVFIFIFGSINYSGDTKIPVGIANNDSGGLSRELIEEIRNDGTVSFVEMKEEQVLSKVQNSGIETGFIIKSGFSKDIQDGKVPEIKVLKLKTSENYMMIESVLRNAMMKISAKNSAVGYVNDKLKDIDGAQKKAAVDETAKKVEDNIKKQDFLTVETIRYSGSQKSDGYNQKAFVTIGFMIMFVMFTIIFSGGGVIMEERKNNTWNRLHMTLASRTTIMAGNTISTFLRGFIQVMFLVLFSKLVIGLDWGRSFAALVVIMSTFIIAVTAFGMFMATLVKTNAQLNAISSVVITCSTMVSGCYWPLEFEPVFMQNMAVIFPQYWAMKGMRNVIENNMGMQSVVTPALTLAVMGIIFFAGSTLIQRTRIKVRKPLLHVKG